MTHTQRIFIIACIFFISSCCCHHNPPTETCSQQADYQKKNTGNGHRVGDGGTQYIPMDSANKMISSYQLSVMPPADPALNCLIVDADVLRSYLNDTCNGNVKSVKLMFAHTLDYINTGHMGQNAGYTPGALTIVIAGYDETGEYVLGSGNTVLDESQGCPASCPISGSATNNIVILSTSKNKK